MRQASWWLARTTIVLEDDRPVPEMSKHQQMVESTWRRFLISGKETKEFRRRHLFGMLPSNPRCKFCNAPFHGVGGVVMRLVYDKRRSKMNPRLCSTCENFAAHYQGGVEIEMSLLFADVRGSTTLAEGMSPVEFSRLINRFYNAVTDVLIKTDALIDKLIGDQAAGIYVPGFAGEDHARRAVDAAREVLRVTGHNNSDGPWIPLGVGVHTGVAFLGAVGSKDGTTDITVLGDVPNTAARLSSEAAPGEILVSGAASMAAGLGPGTAENRTLQLKGKNEPVEVSVLTDY